MVILVILVFKNYRCAGRFSKPPINGINDKPL